MRPPPLVDADAVVTLGAVYVDGSYWLGVVVYWLGVVYVDVSGYVRGMYDWLDDVLGGGI